MKLRRLAVVVALLCLSPCPQSRPVPAPVPPPATSVIARVQQESSDPPVLEGLGYVFEGEPAPAPAPAPRIPARRTEFAASCESGCGRKPTGRPSPPDPVKLPDELAVRRLSIRVPRWQQVEVAGQMHLKDVQLVAPDAPLTFQVYTDAGKVARCTVPPGVSGTVNVTWRDRVHRLEPGGSECTLVGQYGYFSVYEVLPFPPAAIEAMLSAAMAALRPELFVQDDAVTRWLRSSAEFRLGEASLHRRTAISGGMHSVVAMHLDLPGTVQNEYGEWVCRQCAFDQRFVGERRVEGTVALLDERAATYCHAWDKPGEETFALVVDDRLQTTWRATGPCVPSHPYQYSVPRIPFDAPAIPPWIPQPDPELPSVVRKPWRLPARPQPAAAAPPPAVEADLARLGAWLAANESDPFLRAKSVHDWIATNIRYDYPAYAAKSYPPQDAATVFRTRTGVCAGYSNLFVALAGAAGLDAVYVPGEAVTQGRREGHAWNAVRLVDRWYLLDTTWDGGADRYETEWLFPPPERFLATHFPDDPAWQLVAKPLSLDEALGRPELGHGLVLLEPRNATVATDGRTLWVNVSSADLRRPRIAARPQAGGPLVPCEPVDGGALCSFDEARFPYVIEIATDDGQYAGQILAER